MKFALYWSMKIIFRNMHISPHLSSHRLNSLLMVVMAFAANGLPAQNAKNLGSKYIYDEIIIQNGSFEGIPQCCVAPPAWTDCGFKGETPPDIQPALDYYQQPLFDVTKKPFNGNTYLGMVVRDNDTYERVAQRLTKPLLKGKCYTFSIHLATSPSYKSASNSNPTELKQYTTPIVLQIWGGIGLCNQKELLAQSSLITNHEWQAFEFEFRPKQDITVFELSAYYKTPILMPYNGNLLLDNASNIYMVPCPEDPGYKNYISEKDKPATKEVANDTKSKPNVSKTPTATDKKNLPAPPEPPATQKILKELDNKNVKVGQIIKIEKLFFAADSFRIVPESYKVLDELYDFLIQNPKIKIEIGGHTNNIPSDEYCDRLSTFRAKEVQNYLVQKGISPDRITYKGYGKRNPVATNSTKEGRALNQRVEIKIISIAG